MAVLIFADSYYQVIKQQLGSFTANLWRLV